jgi:thiol:disulfide interchange protein DsbD
LGEGVPTAESSTAATPQAPPPSTENASAAFNPKSLKITANDQIRQTSMALAIAMGFLGGLILNLMPCVLPVIGLKILSFIEQSGHSRQHALTLNLWYSLGLLSVFWVLATLAVTLGMGWGQLFSYNGFNITLAAIVFVMGLSFLGIWEIPLPGFVGRGKAVELMEKEGASGAFFKGVLTTILATPCSAPFLAPALTWAVSQPAPQTYAVFTAVGLGMASPYLLIGAFPGLIAFLPKPGAWMDTFKQIMGFVLLATVVFILTFLPMARVVPTVGFLFGLWAACWWIGRVSPIAESGERTRAWLAAVIIAGLAWICTFGWLVNMMQGHFDRAVEEAIAGRITAPNGLATGKNADQLPWQPFTQKALEDATASNATVLVDFTADWCLTCKTLEATVLNTKAICDAVQTNGIVTLRADWTHGQPEVTTMLELLGSKQVPVLAIFPAGNPNQPIVLRGGYTQQTLLDALKKAGPSKNR